jgi:hypothetical protein
VASLQLQENLLTELNKQMAITPDAVEYQRATDTGLYEIKEVRLSWEKFSALVCEVLK